MINFLPLTLFQQLKNIVNIFFLLNSFLQSRRNISTNNPLVSLLPTLYSIIVGMIFELIGDYRRWKSDQIVNNQIVKKMVLNKK